MLSVTSAKLTGLPGESGWAQVHDFTPDDPEKLKARGKLFAVVATSRVEDGVEIVSSGRELISRLHEEYFGDLSQKPFNALSGAVEKVISEFKENWGDVEIAACAFVEGVAFSAAGGGAKVIICRDGALATILDSSDGRTVSASGFPKAGDTLLLGTKSFFGNIPSGVIKAGLQDPNLDVSAEAFAPTIHGVENSGTLGAAIIKFNEERTEVVVSEPTSSPKTFENAKNFFRKTVSAFIKKLPERGIYVKNPINDEVVSQNKKVTFTVAIVLLLILGVSIGFGIRQKRINDVRGQYQVMLSEAEREADEAISLASVSPDKSRELFSQSIQKLEQISALNVKDARVEALRKKINDSRAAILGEYDGSGELFLDLGLLTSGFKGDAISVSGGNVFILDKEGKRVVSVEISTKKSKVAAGPSVIDEALDLAAYEERVFILSGDGIYEVGSNKTRVIEKEWEGGAFIKAFGGNLYVLDKSGNAIYRYSGEGTSFGSKQGWLSASTKADFSDARSWSIDGAVYVLYPNSRILKYSLGSPQAFRLSGVIPEVGSIDAVYADPNNQYVYLLDAAGKRIVVIDKTGLYKAQYRGDQIGVSTNLVVSETDKKIILLTGDKLLSIELKHL